MKDLRDDPAELTEQEKILREALGDEEYEKLTAEAFGKALEEAEKDILHNHPFFKEQTAYCESEKNLKDCEPYDELDRKFFELKRQYESSFEAMRKAAEAAAYRSEYSKGGECIHRGYYSPSATDMYVIGGGRGRLYKRTPKPGQYDYEYVFDKDGNLICVKKYAEEFEGIYTFEMFRREHDRTLSFIFNAFDNDLEGITECRYENGALVRYEYALLFREVSYCLEINVERFEYENGRLKTAYSDTYSPRHKTLEKNKYTFSRNAEGCITEYVSENMSGYVMMQNGNESVKFESSPVLGAHKHTPLLWESITAEKHEMKATRLSDK